MSLYLDDVLARYPYGQQPHPTALRMVAIRSSGAILIRTPGWEEEAWEVLRDAYAQAARGAA